MKGFFVTGTDTGVGKTVASACLVAGLREDEEVCYWKPVQTGIEEDDDTDGDGIFNMFDGDDDNDGRPTFIEIEIDKDGNVTFPDEDGDGTPDYLDSDS